MRLRKAVKSVDSFGLRPAVQEMLNLSVNHLECFTHPQADTGKAGCVQDFLTNYLESPWSQHKAHGDVIRIYTDVALPLLLFERLFELHSTERPASTGSATHLSKTLASQKPRHEQSAMSASAKTQLWGKDDYLGPPRARRISLP